MHPGPDEFVICLGGNAPDADSRLAAAHHVIAARGTIVAASPRYRTDPEHAGEKGPYLNQLIVLRSPLALETLREELKTYETGVRAANTFAGYVNLDIDIVMHGQRVLRPRDYAAAYFRLGAEMMHLF